MGDAQNRVAANHEERQRFQGMAGDLVEIIIGGHKRGIIRQRNRDLRRRGIRPAAILPC